MPYPTNRDIAIATLQSILENIRGNEETVIGKDGLAHAGISNALEIISASEQGEAVQPSHNSGSTEITPVCKGCRLLDGCCLDGKEINGCWRYKPA